MSQIVSKATFPAPIFGRVVQGLLQSQVLDLEVQDEVQIHVSGVGEDGVLLLANLAQYLLLSIHNFAMGNGKL